MRALARTLDVAPDAVVAMWRELRERLVEQAPVVSDALRARYDLEPDDTARLDQIVADITGRATGS